MTSESQHRELEKLAHDSDDQCNTRPMAVRSTIIQQVVVFAWKREMYASSFQWLLDVASRHALLSNVPNAFHEVVKPVPDGPCPVKTGANA